MDYCITGRANPIFAKFLSRIKGNFWESAVSMILALYWKFPFILDRNLAEANCTGNQVCTSCDTAVLVLEVNYLPKYLAIGWACGCPRQYTWFLCPPIGLPDALTISCWREGSSSWEPAGKWTPWPGWAWDPSPGPNWVPWPWKRTLPFWGPDWGRLPV